MGVVLGRHTCELSKLLNEGWVRGGGREKGRGRGSPPSDRSSELVFPHGGAVRNGCTILVCMEEAGVIEVGLNHVKGNCRAALSFTWLGPRSEFIVHESG